jgi:hypothetical protein
MTDRDLLELAAKAAGIEVIRSRLHDPLQEDMLVKTSKRNSGQLHGPWNPLADDGDLYRLAERCKMIVDFDGENVRWEFDGERYKRELSFQQCGGAARAIVTAAAAIGRQMK